MENDILEVCAGCGAGIRNRRNRPFKCPHYKCGEFTNDEYQGLIDIYDVDKYEKPETPNKEQAQLDMFAESEEEGEKKSKEEKELSIITETDTGDIWQCRKCGEKYHLIHREVEKGPARIRKTHLLEKVVE